MDKRKSVEVESKSAAFERALVREILASERMRALAVLGVLVLVTFFVIVGAVLSPGLMSRVMRVPVSDLFPLAVLAPFLIYEIVVLVVLRYRWNRGRDVPMFARFATATFETSLPTALMLTAGKIAGPDFAFGTWPSTLYFVFIVVATLRLNFYLPFYTGALAAASYLGVAYLVFDPENTSFLGLPFVLGPKAFSLLAAGFVAGLVGARLGAKFRHMAAITVERERMTDLFGQHVSPAVLERLLANPTDFADEAREVCVMFLDIRDFTTQARQRPPAEVVAYLNSAFAFMIEAVDRQGGIVNKFLGDGFMAIFGAPLDDPDAVRHAVSAAREILAEIDKRGLDEAAWPLRVGIGLHVGAAVTGNVGSPRRKEFTAVGDVVNLASRLEQLTKVYDARLLASQAIVGALGEFAGGAAPMGSVEIKGYPAPVPVWRLG